MKDGVVMHSNTGHFKIAPSFGRYDTAQAAQGDHFGPEPERRPRPYYLKRIFIKSDLGPGKFGRIVWIVKFSGIPQSGVHSIEIYLRVNTV